MKTRTNSLCWKEIKMQEWHPTCAVTDTHEHYTVSATLPALQPPTVCSIGLSTQTHTALITFKLPFVSKKSCGQPFKTPKICSDVSSSSF